MKFKSLGLLVDSNKIHTEALDWAKELTQVGGIFSSDAVRPDLRQTQSRTILSKSGKRISGLMLPEDRLSIGTSALFPVVSLGASYTALATMMAGKSGILAGAADMLSSGSMSGLGIGTLALGGVAAALLASGAITVDAMAIGGIALLGLSSAGAAMATGALLPTVLAWIAPSALVWQLNKMQNKKRATRLAHQQAAHAKTHGESFIGDKDQFNEIAKQIQNADNDKSPFINVGEASGNFKANGVTSAPTRGTKSGLTINDLKTHLLYLGRSGTGKTTNLRYVAWQIAQRSDCGLLVMDGKGVLADEMRLKTEGGILDYILSPKTIAHFNPLDGLTPQLVSQTMKNAAGGDTSSGDQIWSSAGGTNEFFAAAVQELLVEMQDEGNVHPSVIAEFKKSTTELWTGIGEYDSSFMSFKRIGLELLTAPEENQTHQLLAILMNHSGYKNDNDKAKAVFIDSCIEYIERKSQPGAERISSSVEFTSDTWNGLITQNQKLIDWAISVVSDFDVLDCLKGKRIGISLPYTEYGIAGRIITQLIQVKVLNAAAQRPTDWARNGSGHKQMFLIIDELQDIVTLELSKRAAMLRSQGVGIIGASQSESAFIEAIGDKATRTLMTQFSSRVWYDVTDELSQNEMVRLCGKTQIIRSSYKTNGAIDFDKTAEIILDSPEFNANHPDAQYMDARQKGSFTNALGKFFKNDQVTASSVKVATYEQVSAEPQFVVTHIEINKLKTLGNAIVSLKTAGMQMTDLMKMSGLDENFKPI